MREIVLLITFYLACLCDEYDCAKILCFFSLGLYSRNTVFQALTSELARRGHELTVLTSRPRSAPVANLTEIDVSTASTNSWTTHIQSSTEANLLLRLRLVLNSSLNEFEEQLQTETFREVMREKKKYDVLIVDGSLCGPALALSHVFRVPAVLIRTSVPYLGDHEIVSSEMHSLFLYLTRTKANPFPSFWDAASQMYDDYRVGQSLSEAEDILDDILKRNFGPDMPPIKELRHNVRALIVNMHWLWDHNLPVPPNMVYLGNILPKTNGSLPEDIQNYLDASAHGVILLSFGSIFDFSALPEATAALFLRALGALPHDVLLKSRRPPPRAPRNVRVYRWLPQSDVLAHPKVKLFITQGGMHSTAEAIGAGVPLLALPMYNDQWHNADQCERFHIGLKLTLSTLSEETLFNAITKIIGDPSFPAAVRRLRARLEARVGPLERAARVVERAARAPLPRPAHEPWPELPLAAAAALLMLALLAAVLYLIYFVSVLCKKILLRVSLVLRKH